MTATLVVIVLPPVFGLLSERLLALPPDVARLAHRATVLLVPWPAAIGYRRFYQGVLVRNHLTRRVAWGTVVRLVDDVRRRLPAWRWGRTLPGAHIAALALSAGVVAEAAASRFMARQLVAALLAGDGSGPVPGPRELARFYFPLALTSMISMATGPLLDLLHEPRPERGGVPRRVAGRQRASSSSSGAAAWRARKWAWP